MKRLGSPENKRAKRVASASLCVAIGAPAITACSSPRHSAHEAQPQATPSPESSAYNAWWKATLKRDQRIQAKLARTYGTYAEPVFELMYSDDPNPAFSIVLDMSYLKSETNDALPSTFKGGRAAYYNFLQHSYEHEVASSNNPTLPRHFYEEYGRLAVVPDPDTMDGREQMAAFINTQIPPSAG